MTTRIAGCVSGLVLFVLWLALCHCAADPGDPYKGSSVELNEGGDE